MLPSVFALSRQAILTGWRMAPALCRHSFSGLAESVTVEGNREAVPVSGPSGQQAVLIRLPERAFGALSELPRSLVHELAGSDAKSVAVVREAFVPSDVPPRPLCQTLQPLARGAVALAADTQLPTGRMLVDEYTVGSSGSFVLRGSSTELAAYLAEMEQRVALVPDVGAALRSTATGAPPNSVKAALGGPRQSSRRVLMVAPTAFGFNEQAAADNSFMHCAETAGEGSSLTRTVLAEFAGLHRALADGAGVSVDLHGHHLRHGTPDAVFPNNWFSTHRDGEAAGGVAKSTLVLYPMKCPNRAMERRPEVVEVLRLRGYERVLDLSAAEGRQQYFEGTGVLVLDRINGVAYVDLSERAHEALARQWVDALGYKKLVCFRSSDLRGKAVYHTNVMMAVGTDVAVVCADSVSDAGERQALMSSLRETHEVVEISLEQMDALCGNVLEVVNRNGLPVMAMSSQAYNAFTPQQRQVLRRHVADLVHAPIDTLESVGGGGVRCCIAEIF